MNNLTPSTAPSETLPQLIDRAAQTLLDARGSAEVLEARQFARAAYDAAKSAGRIAKAQKAHDEVVSKVHRAQADALVIRAQAELRLADEYDAAQERGEVRTQADNQHVADANKLSPQDLGLRRDEIHEARKIRDAEQVNPGIVERTLDDLVDRGEEPTRAALQASVLAAISDARQRPDRRNPHRVKDDMTDRVFKFSGLCRSLAEFADVEAIAAWGRIPQTAQNLPAEVREAMLILSRFMEAQGER